MLTHFDHVTIVVRDVASAKAFFALLGFAEERSLVISGGNYSRPHCTGLAAKRRKRRKRGRVG